jgi:UDP-N-acetyl-D-glucosamine/UDP-N-acetyl-D-galactosamine dehydrogenase
MKETETPRIAVIGLGYVGLPLAAAFAGQFPVVGFDINAAKVAAISSGVDPSQELASDALNAALAAGLTVSNTESDLSSANIYIVTVPTDIFPDKTPDLGPLQQASNLVGSFLTEGDLVIYESTTYPGCTEEICVPILESASGLAFNEGFHVGYSPERINPGDPTRDVTTILKVTSGSTPEVGKRVDALYRTIVTAGTHLAPSIKVAEAAKAIENAQRDVNISFVNELAVIFDRMGIDTGDVLAAAGTKWNFLPFKPGLVGGHCISVDPYYLAHKAKSLGHDPAVILSGRRINDSMGLHVASAVVKLMQRKGVTVVGARALILGITFKENTADTRNSRVVDVYSELADFGLDVDVFDPLASADAVLSHYGISLLEKQPADLASYAVIVLAVAHDAFLELDIRTGAGRVVYDIKGVLPRAAVDQRL